MSPAKVQNNCQQRASQDAELENMSLSGANRESLLIEKDKLNRQSRLD
jgi:hypothetical protein